MASNNERRILRNLAKRWMELSSLPIMKERKHLWTELKDLKAQRPMVLVETYFIEDYVSDTELHCEDPLLRTVEKQMLWIIRHAEEVGDDIVIEPCYQLYWDMEISDYGVPIECSHAKDSRGSSLAYSFNNPVRTVEDIGKLKPRTRKVDRGKTMTRKELLEDIIGDILPVTVHGNKGIHAGLTQDLFKMLGVENMMLWIYDEPEALQYIMAYLRDDRLAQFKWMEQEGLLGLNNSNQTIGSGGSGSPGYTTALPGTDYTGPVRLKDVWVWMESQETVSISPQNFTEFFLPYMADICRNFGLVYYGCCEPVHDRWEYISKAIPNIRAVSISPWCDMFKMGEILGRNSVFSRKPMPAYISGETADWDMLRNDAEDTLKAARGCNLEFIFRDIYTLNGDRSRLAKWVEMVRALMNG